MQYQPDSWKYRGFGLLGGILVLACSSPDSGTGQPGNGSGGNSSTTSGGVSAGGASATGGASVVSTGGALAATGGAPGAATGGVSSGVAGSAGGVNAAGGSVAQGGSTPLGGSVGAAGAGAGGVTQSAGASNGGAPSGGGSAGGTGGGSAGGNAAAGSAVGGSATAGGAGSSVPLDPSLLSRCTGTNPIQCTLTAPNGNYDVSVELGDTAASASSRVQAETRHYIGTEVATAAGAVSLQTFTVNVRQEAHDGGQSAPGNVLDLLIDGAAPKLRGLGFRAAPSAVTVFVAGDSTACDWVATNSSALADDETGWAQELSMYFKAGVSVANYADSGETAGGFYSKFFPAARSAMKAGDYLFISFGHNDQKNTADVDNYKANLMKYVTDARAKSATPVILTPVSRSGGSSANPGFAGVDQLARDIAAEQSVALIDLTALSRAYYATVPDKNALFIDGTHFREVGAIGVAGVVAQAIKGGSLPLKAFVK